MDPELKRQWVAALRSGKYRQIAKSLRKSVNGRNRFCCLGVLCEIAGEEKVRGGYKDKRGEWRTGTLSPEQTDRLGLPVQIMHNLIDLNDMGKSFVEIADEIEIRV
jgi:hypothetical protein